MKFIFVVLFWLFTINPLWPAESFSIDSWKILGPFRAAPRDSGIDHLVQYGVKNILPQMILKCFIQNIQIRDF